jgi:hypothetical protein
MNATAEAADRVDCVRQGDCFEICAPNCAWVIPVLLESHASAAATLAFRSSSRIHLIDSLSHLFISLRKFSSVKHVIIIAPDTLNPDVASALKSVVDQFIQRAPPVISQPQLPRWKTDDGSYRLKLLKAHALSLEQFEKARPLLFALVVCRALTHMTRWPLLTSHW